MTAIADREIEPGYAEAHLTIGDWPTEEASAAAFDDRLVPGDLFRVYREVPGVLIQPRMGQIDKTMRIDRVLIPTPALRAAGWTHGAVGVEIKRSGVKLGPPLAQAMDYVRTAWFVNGICVQLHAVFLWPMARPYGPLESVMVQSRVGAASSSSWYSLNLNFGGENVLCVRPDGTFQVNDRASGRRAGSR